MEEDEGVTRAEGEGVRRRRRGDGEASLLFSALVAVGKR